MNFDVSFITVEHFTILVCLAPLTQSSPTFIYLTCSRSSCCFVKLREHRLCVLECLYLPRQFVRSHLLLWCRHGSCNVQCIRCFLNECRSM
jgi:hypothetical protein